MAVGQLNLSRRALLGAVCVGSVLPSAGLALVRAGEGPFFFRHPGLDPGSTFFPSAGQERWIPGRARNDDGPVARTLTNWNRALARYRRAETALEAVKGSADDHLYDRLLGRLLKTLARLLRIPAPHLPALAAKLDLLVAHQVWELRFAEPSLTAMQRDARRLAARSS
jgi:hypothetical protein